MAKSKKNILIISGISALVIGGLVSAYIFGVQQGRFLVAEASRSTIIEALDTQKSEAEVDQVVSEVDETAKLKEVSKTIEAEEKAKTDTAASGEKSVTPAPSPAKETQPAPEKQVMRGITLTNPLVSVETQSVVFSAKLPESLVGDCKVFLQRVGDKAGAWHYNKSDSPRSTCVTTIARSKLAAGTWQYELTFMSSTVYGQNNPKGSFTLN